jgi:hypothetical protein
MYLTYDWQNFTHEGRNYRARLDVDQHNGAKWENEDGHGEVSDWTTRDKAPGEMVLAEDRRFKRYYDFAGAVAKAKAEGWNAAPYYPPGEETKGQRAHKAAVSDFNRLRDWCNDNWCYVGVIVEALDDEGEPTGENASLWGIESDCDEYQAEVAFELAAELAPAIAA